MQRLGGRLYKTFWEIIVGLQTGGKLEPQNRWEMKHWALEQVGDWKNGPKNKCMMGYCSRKLMGVERVVPKAGGRLETGSKTIVEWKVGPQISWEMGDWSPKSGWDTPATIPSHTYMHKFAPMHYFRSSENQILPCKCLCN